MNASRPKLHTYPLVATWSGTNYVVRDPEEVWGHIYLVQDGKPYFLPGTEKFAGKILHFSSELLAAVAKLMEALNEDPNHRPVNCEIKYLT